MLKAIMKYPLVIIQEKEIHISQEDVRKFSEMSTWDKAHFIFERVETFSTFEKVTGLSLIEDALSVGAAGLYVKLHTKACRRL